jgi:hypothetical protein
VVAALVGFGADLEQVVGIVPGRRDQAARPVVLEAARRHHHPGTGQRGAERVAREGPDAAALEVHAQRPRAVYPFAGDGLGQAAHHLPSSRSRATG